MAANKIKLNVCGASYVGVTQKKAEDGADNMRSQVHEYLEDASKARMEALDASRKLAALQKQVAALKERLGEV